MLPLLQTFINSFSMGIRPVFEKFAISEINRIQFSYIRYIFSGIISIIFLIIYQNFFYKEKKESLFNFNYFKKYSFWGIVISFIAITEILANYYLIQKYEVYKVTAIVASLSIIFNTLLSVLLLKEKLNIIRGIGILIIIIGIILVNCF